MKEERQGQVYRPPASLNAGETIAVAESCTGGMIAARLTEAPGASAYFAGGAVTYTDAVKTRVLGVPAAMLRMYGAVSEPVARAMAEGVLRVYQATWAMATTGFAGPGGGNAAEPVGTVYIATGRAGEIAVRRYVFAGNREDVRRQAVEAAWIQLERHWTVKEE